MFRNPTVTSVLLNYVFRHIIFYNALNHNIRQSFHLDNGKSDLNHFNLPAFHDLLNTTNTRQPSNNISVQKLLEKNQCQKQDTYYTNPAIHFLQTYKNGLFHRFTINRYKTTAVYSRIDRVKFN